MRLLVAACVAAMLAALGASPAGAFTGTYDGAQRAWSWQTWSWQDTCTRETPFLGREPAGDGRFPVLVYLTDSERLYQGASAQAFLDEAVAQGFVAVSLDYSPGLHYAAGWAANARCASRGVLEQVCSRPKADCSQGIVAAGFSQGGAIAIRMHARAAYVIGVNDDMRPAMPVRVVNGQRDNAKGTATILVTDSQVQDGEADHCYLHHRPFAWWDVSKWFVCATQPMDPGWRHGSADWTLPAGIAWLRGHTG